MATYGRTTAGDSGRTESCTRNFYPYTEVVVPVSWEVTSITGRIRHNIGGNIYVRGIICDNTGATIACTPEVQVPATGSTWAWRTFTFSSPVTLDAGGKYYFGVMSSTSSVITLNGFYNTSDIYDCGHLHHEALLYSNLCSDSFDTVTEAVDDNRIDLCLYLTYTDAGCALGNRDESKYAYSVPSTYKYMITKTDVATCGGEVEKFGIYMNTNGLTGKSFWLAIYNTDGNRLYADSSHRHFPGGVGYYAWRRYSPQGTAPTITVGESYYILIFGTNAGGYPRVGYTVDAGMGGWITHAGDLYPAYVDFSGIVQPNESMCMFIDLGVASGPPLGPEGITPGAIEFTTWEDVSDVY